MRSATIWKIVPVDRGHHTLQNIKKYASIFQCKKLKKYSHMYPMSQDFIRMAVSIGSSGFSGGGFRAVFTEQNRQPRVQVSPINIIVAKKGEF